MLSNISKQIIYNRLLDQNITINISDLDNYIIDTNNFIDLNSMYNFIVNNWRSLIVE